MSTDCRSAHRLTASGLAILLWGLAPLGCGESKRDTGNPNPNPNPKPPVLVCGNGILNGLEACDGTAFAQSRSCSDYGLGTGQVSCSPSCGLVFGTCAFTDYCTANNLYSNGLCDNCELLGGVADPECMTKCGADGMCGDRFDPLTGNWTCRRRGMIDPDCGTCGNSIIEGNELCDGPTFKPGGSRCEDFGYEDGALSCNNCLPVFTSCRASLCGDGMIEGMETCEGSNFNGQSCEGAGFAGGMLTCTATCGVSRAACVAPGCGNNIVEAGRGETCEAGNLSGASCQSLGFAAGDLACDSSCRHDTSDCVSPGCGNGLIEAPIEQCEGTNLNGATCMSQGFLTGTLACSPSSCTFDTAGCVAPGCGNQIIEGPTEQCEGANLAGATCQTRGFIAGTLSCNSSCRYDESACVAGGCGNGIIETPNEQCEGSNLNGATCQSQGFNGGTLSCNACRFDTTACTGSAACGNNQVEGLEACDMTAQPFPTSCSSWGLGAGIVRCNSSCRLDFSSCSGGDFCQDRGLYNNGLCDPCQLLGGTPDPDCDSCISDGQCVSYIDQIFANYSCVTATGAQDPDCGCGNGTLHPDAPDGTILEICDGTQFQAGFDTCVAWGYSGGNLSCDSQCLPFFMGCVP